MSGEKPENQLGSGESEKILFTTENTENTEKSWSNSTEVVKGKYFSP